MRMQFRFFLLVISMCVLVSVGSSPTQALTDSGISFGPYIQRVKKTAVSILIHTDMSAPVKLRYRKVGKTDWNNVVDTASNQHSFRIKNLKEDTEYEYYFKNADGERITMTYTFRTKRDVTEDEPLRVAVFGDSGAFTTDQMRVATQMQWWKPELLVHTGDIAYESGTTDDFVLTFFKPYQPLIAEVPFYGSIGNHDYTTDQAGPYKELFETPTTYSDSEDYYAFDYDSTHFVSLNSNLDYSEGSEMYSWLVNDLADTNKPWKIVFFHHPVYSSGEHGSTTGMAEVLGPVFEQYDVDLVLNGHDHNYERNTKVNGVMYVVTGGGGRSLYDAVNENPQSKIFISEYHFLGLMITDTTLTAQAIDKRGYKFDTFELTQ